MTSSEWHRYFDDYDASNWNDPKKLRYQKANDVVTKSLLSLINDCEDDVKNQAAAKLLANKASMATIVNARRNQLFADPLNAFLDAWLCRDVDMQYKNLEQLAHTKLNCEQIDNVTRFSSALTGAAVKNLSNVIPELTSVIPSKRPLESLNSEIASTGQEIPEGARTPPPISPPNKEDSKRIQPKRQSTESNDFDDSEIEDAQEYKQDGSRTPPTIATPPTFTTLSIRRTKNLINE
ncbi:14421_t:CDS:2 [Funneliformis caledonium]|uniref:14421_t:CDS:1 n=1 Tax=Funneliformis caledonium TaxID=1117310 RepID=A0A9N8VMF0_9GLOM|nr:14421_t:CDS:2 [Funneliformis caledonium]